MGAARVNVRLSSVISASGETGTGSKHAPNRAIFTEKKTSKFSPRMDKNLPQKPISRPIMEETPLPISHCLYPLPVLWLHPCWHWQPVVELVCYYAVIHFIVYFSVFDCITW